MPTEMITAALVLATQVLQLINTEQAMKYVDQLKDAETDLQKEKAKGYNSDDAKVEFLEGQITILLQAANAQLSIFTASKAGGSNAPTIPAVSLSAPKSV